MKTDLFQFFSHCWVFQICWHIEYSTFTASSFRSHRIRSDQISRSVVSDSLQPHESQHSRPPCPSPTPGVHWDSRPSSHITSWQIDGETVRDFIFWGFKITSDGDCSHEIKRHLLLGRSYDQPREHIKKQRHYFTNKGPSSQSYGFSVVMYGCESWTIKKADCERIDAFELWCWRRLLRVPWTERRSNQAILNKISPEYSLGGLILIWNSNTLATWCEELTHWKRPWCWERLRAGGEGDHRGWDGCNGITDSMDMSFSRL